jgi:hypothetical protein
LFLSLVVAVAVAAEAVVVVAPERARSGPLRATELFQRSLLEAQFDNSPPDSAPYMVDDDDATTTIVEATGTAVVNVVVGGDDIASVQNSMLRIAASTDRGQNADEVQKVRASRHIASLEKSSNDALTERRRWCPPSSADVVIPPHLAGTWELLYSDTQLFRSSPFFLAGRSMCTTPEQAQQYDGSATCIARLSRYRRSGPCVRSYPKMGDS